jgi:di/tricarboxylate transporter
MATPDGDLVILAARRGDSELKGQDITVLAGDALLLQGSWDDLTRHAESAGVLVVDSPAELRRSVPLGRGARRAIIILAAMVALLATGIVPPAVAGLLAAGALVLTRTVTPAQAYRSISWTTVVLIAGMIPLSTAFIQTGTADLVAGWLLSFLGDASPYVALAILCLLTLVLGQLISNTATVLILAPVAIAVATSLGLSVQPFMMALAVVGAAAFLTPIATPANLMVMEPGGYRFGDYWKLGLPMAVIFLLFAVFYVPLIWPF